MTRAKATFNMKDVFVVIPSWFALFVLTPFNCGVLLDGAAVLDGATSICFTPDHCFDWECRCRDMA